MNQLKVHALKKSKVPLVEFPWFLYLALLTIDFFLTTDPYTSNHGGSDWFIGLQLVGGFIVVVSILARKAYQLNSTVFLASALLAISGFATGGLFSRPLTYLFEIGSLQLCAALAAADVANYPLVKSLDSKFLRFFNSLFLLGIIASLLSIKYGPIFLSISRDNRSEVTLWAVAGFNSYGAALLLSRYFTSKSLFSIIAFLTFATIGVFSYTRTWIEVLFMSTFSFAIVVCRAGRTKKERLIAMGAIYLCLFAVPLLIQFFLLQVSTTPHLQGVNGQKDLTSGRFDLWAYYLSKFQASPWFGNGAFFAENAKDYYGTAHSEIGILKWFAEFGAIFATVILFSVCRACLAAIKLISFEINLIRDNPLLLFSTLTVFSCTPLFLFENVFTLNSAQGLIFWYSIFYVIFYSKRVNVIRSSI